MNKLVPVELDKDTVIYMEADDAVEAPPCGPENSAEPIRSSRGGAIEAALQRFDKIEGSVRALIQQALGAFRDVANANVDKVTLEFGINVSGEAGIPYITKGRGEGNLRIKVECSFPVKTNL